MTAHRRWPVADRGGRRASTFLLSLLFVSVPTAALACPVCFGQSDAPMARATNMGVFFLLGVVVAVLGCFATFFIYLARRARLAADEPAAPVRSAPRVGPSAQEGTA
jgi:hypothetical protein